MWEPSGWAAILGGLAAVITAILVPVQGMVKARYEHGSRDEPDAPAADRFGEVIAILAEIRDGVVQLVDLHDRAAEHRRDREIDDKLARGERERGELLKAVREMLAERGRRGRYQG